MLHGAIPERVHGRMFGLVDSCDCWGFGIAVVAGGALVSTLGGRATFAIAGGMLLIVAVRPRSRCALSGPRRYASPSR